MIKQLVLKVTDSLSPSFAEYMEDESYWIRYQVELGVIRCCAGTVDLLTRYLNIGMGDNWLSTPEHHACTDVATTLHGIDPVKYNFKFK